MQTWTVLGRTAFGEINAFSTLRMLIGRHHNRSAGEVAIAWTLHHPAVTGAIVGARNSLQAEGVMRAGELRLSEKEVAGIETFFAEAAA